MFISYKVIGKGKVQVNSFDTSTGKETNEVKKLDELGKPELIEVIESLAYELGQA